MKKLKMKKYIHHRQMLPIVKKLWHNICCSQFTSTTTEPALNIRLNNHRKDTKNPKAKLVCRHLQQQGHNFNSHAKSIVIAKYLILPALVSRTFNTMRNFQTQKLNILLPYRVNQELSKQKMKTLALPFHVRYNLDKSSQVSLEQR